jgi:hypothetical protein
MNIPGFTAEASLLNSDMHYQATTAATVYGGLVQPAIFDVSTPRQPGISDLFTTTFPPYCRFEYRCQIYHPVFGCLLKGWEYVC